MLTNDMPTNILFIAANPADSQRLGIGQESRTIQATLRSAAHKDNFNLHLSLAASAKDLQAELLDLKPQIVHFSGHGENDMLGFANQDDTTQWVFGESLAALFKLCADHLECVVLNACYSEGIAAAIAEHIPYVIGMENQIEDQDAIFFSDGFYTALFRGEYYDSAFEHGKTRLDLENREARNILRLEQKADTPRQTLVTNRDNDVCLVYPPALKTQANTLLTRLDEQLTSRFGQKNRYRLQTEESTAPNLTELLDKNACTLLLVGQDSHIADTDLSRADSKRLFWLEVLDGRVPDNLKTFSYQFWNRVTEQPLPEADMTYANQVEMLANELFAMLQRLKDEAEQRERIKAQQQTNTTDASPQLNLPDLTFFLDATPEDRLLLTKIEQLLQREGAEYGLSIDPAYINAAADVDNDLRSNLAYCDVFLLIYGQATSYAAIRHRLGLCRRLERERGKPLVAMIVHNDGPTPEKPPPGLNFKNLHVFDCPPHDIEAYLPMCLQEVGDA